MPRRRRPPRAGALADLAPLRIFRQIVLLQTAYYVCAIVLILFTALVAGHRFNLDLVFDWHSLRGDTTVGWMLGLVWMLNSLVGVMFLLLLVARSKLVPDFALTIHCIHLLVTYFYSRSFPKNTLWWTLQLASTALMTLLGMWSCQWRELQPISFGGKGNSTTRDSRQPGSGQAGHLGHQDTGGGMLSSLFGRARGQRADQYELVGIKDEEGGSFR